MQKKIVQKIDFSRNLLLYYIAIGIVILGYVFLSIGGAESFTSLTLGPVVLTVGYLIAVPIALLSGVHKNVTTVEETPEKNPQNKLKK
jgi:hypothetical protein